MKLIEYFTGRRDAADRDVIQVEAKGRLHPSVEAEVLRRASSKEKPIPLADVLKDLGL